MEGEQQTHLPEQLVAEHRPVRALALWHAMERDKELVDHAHAQPGNSLYLVAWQGRLEHVLVFFLVVEGATPQHGAPGSKR